MKRYNNSIENRMTARHKRCMQLVRTIKNKTILDIGCSYGWFEKFGVEMGCKEIVAIDSDEKLLNQAKKQVKANNVTFIKGSALDISRLKEDYFDLVVMFDVIEHIPKNTEILVLIALKRVLKKDGILIISTPYKNFRSDFMDPAWYFGHRHYSKEELIELMNKCGFKCDESSYGGGYYEIFSMMLLYIFKWIFGREIPFKTWFEVKREKEYLSKGGFTTIFIKGIKYD